MNRESNHTPAALSHRLKITTGSILPIDFFYDNIPVARYFKQDNKTGELVPSDGVAPINLDTIQEKHDFFEVGKINSSVQQLIQT
ncbi:MAG TPA: hypothetical protein EYH36_00940, partial [Desulfocapsa sulfexigens]|nr:hypothetical protein [Desulfocapsa sulfexigens]